MDRGYAKFALWNAIVAASSRYLCHVRDNSWYDVLESRELSAEAVLSNEVVPLGATNESASRSDHAVRIVCVRATPHTSRDRYRRTSTGPDCDGVLRIATSRSTFLPN
ncbi:hypothetical protein GC176_24725 [bacterium]|nr:hypothetical protein [bacterium]